MDFYMRDHRLNLAVHLLCRRFGTLVMALDLVAENRQGRLETVSQVVSLHLRAPQRLLIAAQERIEVIYEWLYLLWLFALLNLESPPNKLRRLSWQATICA